MGQSLMDADERELLRTSLQHATLTHTGAALDAALEELGWREALAADSRAAVSLLFEAQGTANATSSALDHVIAAKLGLDLAATTGVVLPGLGRGDPPGEVVDGTVAVRGLGTAGLRRCDAAVVVASAGGEHVVVAVDVTDLTLRPVSGLDPLLGIVEVAESRVSLSPGSALSPATWTAAVSAGRLAVAHELVGAARAMLQLARGHALDRVQFGRPIASFQAVRHRLADSLVAVEAADAALGAAWEDGSPLAAAIAKATAGRGAQLVARHCQQVLAGIGFTSEHPFHRYARRALVLDRLLGDARSLTRQTGEELLRSRRLPAILPL